MTSWRQGWGEITILTTQFVKTTNFLFCPLSKLFSPPLLSLILLPTSKLHQPWFHSFFFPHPNCTNLEWSLSLISNATHTIKTWPHDFPLPWPCVVLHCHPWLRYCVVHLNSQDLSSTFLRHRATSATSTPLRSVSRHPNEEIVVVLCLSLHSLGLWCQDGLVFGGVLICWWLWSTKA